MPQVWWSFNVLSYDPVTYCNIPYLCIKTKSQGCFICTSPRWVSATSSSCLSPYPSPLDFWNIYRISANSCRDNYSFFEAWVRQLFKGDNYSKEETINFFLFGWCTMYICNLNCCRAKVKVSKSQKYFFLKLHCQKNEQIIWQNSSLWS